MILITGAAGFIGFHCARLLLERGDEVVGMDNLNDYYDVNLKQARLALLLRYPNFQFHQLDLADREGLERLFVKYSFHQVINLAAQAGVRYSLINPYAYMDSNLVGFLNILECCRHHQIQHLVYASSSSVYGANLEQPFSEDQAVDHPMSLYAATKKANELMAHSYSSLYGLPTTGLRFFTVYGPWGRPDMALFLFTKKILAEEPIQVFNQGQMVRDFTYVSDIVEGIQKTLNHIAEPDPAWTGGSATSCAPYCIYNIGNSKPVQLMEYIQQIETAVSKKAIYEMMPMQAGDVSSTCADIHRLEQALNYRPVVNIAQGVAQFVSWYRSFYQV